MRLHVILKNQVNVNTQKIIMIVMVIVYLRLIVWEFVAVMQL